jgi:hypothetical protein
MAFLSTPDLRVLQDTVARADAALRANDIETARFELVKVTATLTTMGDGLADPALRSAAFQQYATDEIEIDDEPATSLGEDGTWVAAWVWVPGDDEPRCTACGRAEDECSAEPCDAVIADREAGVTFITPQPNREK